MIEQFIAIARNTFVESIRQPIYLVMIGVGIIALAINPGLSTFTLDNDTRFLVDMGLTTIFLCGLLIAAFVATSVISLEIENKTVLTLISKPLARPVLILAKYVGVSAAILVAATILSITLLLTERHGVLQTARDHLDAPVLWFSFAALFLSVGFGVLCNFFYGWAFTSMTVAALLPLSFLAWVGVLAFDDEWNFQAFASEYNGLLWLSPDFEPQIMVALGSILLALLIISSIAVAASTRFGQVMTTAICIVIFFLGLLTDTFFGDKAFDADPKARIIEVTPMRDLDDDFSDVGDVYAIRVDSSLDIEEEVPYRIASDNLGFGMLGKGTAVLRDRTHSRAQLVKIDDLPMERVPQVDDFLLGGPPKVHWGYRTLWSLFPNLQALSLGDAINQEHYIPWSHVRLLLIYTIAYVTAMLSLAVLLFQTREVG